MTHLTERAHLPGVRLHRRRPPSRPRAEARPEARQRLGKVLVVAGWIVAMVGVGVYCVASFAAESDAGLAAILLEGTIPVARAGLLVIGGGTLMWLVGSVLHLNASLDVEDGDARER